MEFDRRAAVAREPLLSRHAAWLLVTLAYLYVFPYYERINNPNENVRIWMTRAIVEHHVLNIDQVSREWGYVNDKATTGGHLYSSKAPGTSFLGVPVLFVETKLHRLLGMPPPTKRQATLWLRVFSVELPMSLFLFFFARYVERVSALARRRAICWWSAWGWGRCSIPTASCSSGTRRRRRWPSRATCCFRGASPRDAPQALRPARGTTAAGRRRIDTHTPTQHLIWAGFLAALSVMFEYQALLVLRDAGGLRLGALPAARGGVPRGRGAGGGAAGAVPHGAVRAAVALSLRIHREPRLPAHRAQRRLSRPGAAQAVGDRRPRCSRPTTVCSCFSPFLAMGAVCAPRWRWCAAPRREGTLVLAVVVVMLVFLGGMSNWRAGWCVGPRYIATVAPFLAAGDRARVAPGRARGRVALSVAVAGLVIVSVVLNARLRGGLSALPDRVQQPGLRSRVPAAGRRLRAVQPGAAAVFSGSVVAGAAGGRAAAGAVAGDRGRGFACRRAGRSHAAIAVVIAALCLVRSAATAAGPTRPRRAPPRSSVRPGSRAAPVSAGLAPDPVVEHQQRPQRLRAILPPRLVLLLPRRRTSRGRGRPGPTAASSVITASTRARSGPASQRGQRDREALLGAVDHLRRGRCPWRRA